MTRHQRMNADIAISNNTDLLEEVSPRHSATVLFCTIAVLVVTFSNTFPALRAAFFALFALAIIVPVLLRSRARPSALIVTASLLFIAYNLILLALHPLNETSFYNGLLAVMCAGLLLSFMSLAPEPRQLVAFVRQLGWLARILLILGLVAQVTGSTLNWNTKTGMLWLLLFFVLIDPKVSRWGKFAFLAIWFMQAFALDDRAYLFLPVLAFATYLLWPVLTRIRPLGLIAIIAFFAALALFPVLYVQLSMSDHRQFLDSLALEYTDGRFFSGRDVIWYHMLSAASEQGIAFGGGHAIGPGEVFAHGVSAHNTFVSVLARTGIVGLVLFFFVFVAVLVTDARHRADSVVRWSAAFTIGLLFKQSTELSMLGNNVAFASLSWLVIAFGIIHVNSKSRTQPARNLSTKQ